MNFLLRPAAVHNVPPPLPTTPEKVPAQEPPPETRHAMKPSATLEGLISDDPFPQPDDTDGEADGIRSENGPFAKNDYLRGENHSDVSEEEGWITIPHRELPENWNDTPNMHSLRSLDRSFVFPGEQVHILACLSAYKEDVEIMTPFKVAALMSKNGIGKSPERANGNDKDARNYMSEEGEVLNEGQVIGKDGNDPSKQKNGLQNEIFASESFLRMEDRKRQTETLLQKFKNSHFFVRIAESGEPLWSKRTVASNEFDEMDGQHSTRNGTKRSASNMSHYSAFIDKGNFDANVSGGAARNSVQCYSLPNGDIVVLLQVNIGVNFLREPVIEILQFEKYQERSTSPENPVNFSSANSDPCGALLKWLLPLDNTLPPPSRSLSPPQLSSSPGIVGASQKSTSSGSQLFSHFRSYSMSSLPQNTAPPPQPAKPQNSRTSIDLEDWGQYSSQKLWKSQRTVEEGILTFRGVSLERDRFSVRCGLEGIFIPGRRWRRKVELIQPVEIHSFAADCNTDDLICVQIKNVSPAYTPDIVVYIDAISIVFEEASKDGPPSSLPISCIEAGNDHCLPNLALRRGEEHSFILKPASSMRKNLKFHGQKVSSTSSLRHAPNIVEKNSFSSADQYAIMVSCRCNYTESRLFFKQPTSWRPRISRDLMISVASEMSGQFSGPNERVSQLPVQVLTLRASNLTSEDLTLTVLAPASFTSPPTMGSLSSSPSSPLSPFVSVSGSTGIISGERHGIAMQRLSSAPPASENKKQTVDGGARSTSFNEQSSPISDVIPSTGFSCTHLWLQSRVPLGCVPAQSTATIKLELLPLTDGIITLDTLRIDVKEKGLAYIPEHSLKINATSSISTGIM